MEDCASDLYLGKPQWRTDNTECFSLALCLSNRPFSDIPPCISRCAHVEYPSGCRLRFGLVLLSWTRLSSQQSRSVQYSRITRMHWVSVSDLSPKDDLRVGEPRSVSCGSVSGLGACFEVVRQSGPTLNRGVVHFIVGLETPTPRGCDLH